MSKNEKKFKEVNVEFVENLQQLFSWISSTLFFWKMDTIFPTNLIKECCDDFYTEIENLLFPLDDKPF